MNDHRRDKNWSAAVQMLKDAHRVVAFTGAGISAESGLATFRDAGGFWNEFPPEQFANWRGLMETALLEPKRLADFLLAVLEPMAHARPNAAHQALAELERSKAVTVVTQNIDGLHQDAGSTKVLEVHGSLFELVPMLSREPLGRLTRQDLAEIVQEIRAAREATWTAPRLWRALQPLFGVQVTGTRRPNIVLFGDAMAEPAWSNALAAARECDVLLCVGTSQSVYPAASLLDEARAAGARVIVIDPLHGGGDVWLPGSATDILPRFVQAAED